MNRSEAKLHRKEVELINHPSLRKALAKALKGERIDPDTVRLPRPRPIQLNKRFTSTEGRAGSHLEISHRFWKECNGWEMRDLLKHEILHYLFADNGWEGFGGNHDHCQKRWKRILWCWGVRDHTNYKWKHRCSECGRDWTVNHHHDSPKTIFCRWCRRMVRTKLSRDF